MSEPVLRTTPQRWMTSSIAWLASHLRWQSFTNASTLLNDCWPRGQIAPY